MEQSEIPLLPSETNIEHLINVSEDLLFQHPSLDDVRRALGYLYLTRANQLVTRSEGKITAESCAEQMSYFKKAIRLSKNNIEAATIEAYLKISLIYDSLGNAEESKRYFDEMIRLIPRVANRDAFDLIQKFEGMLSNFSGNVEAVEALASLYMKYGSWLMWEKASDHDFDGLTAPIAIWKKAFELAPRLKSSELHECIYSAATCVLLQGRPEEALQMVARALEAQEAASAEHPLGKLGIRVFQTRSATLTNIGQLVNEMEFYAKTGEMGLRPPRAWRASRQGGGKS